jgi:hypothetical protein
MTSDGDDGEKNFGWELGSLKSGEVEGGVVVDSFC